MHKKVRKMGVAAGLVLVLLVGLVSGCSEKTPKETAEASPTASAGQPSEGTASGAPAAPDLTPVTYTINTADDKLNWDTPINKKITEKTGVTFKYDVSVGDQFQKWDLWLAASDYPDIMVMDAKYVQKYKDAGAIIPLTELIEQYGPHIKEKFGEYYNLQKDADGEIYSVYGVNRSQEASPNASANFVVQYDVLKEAGYPEIKTLDQLYEVIKAYADKHPKIDGKDTIGFAGAMASYMMGIEFNNPIVSADGLPDHGSFRVLDSGEVQYNPVTESAKTYYTFLNKLYNAGLFDKEAFSLDNIKTKMAQGRVLAAYAPGWTMGDAEKSLRAANQPERAYAHIPIYFSADTVDRTYTMTPTQAGNYQWTITKDTKNPERIIQMIDFLFSDEGQILTQWGIEGLHFEMVDGKRTLKQELLDKRQADPDADYKEGFKGVGTGNYYWFGIGNGAKLGDGDYATPVTKESVIKDYDETTKQVLAQYGKEVWADFLPPVEVVPGYLWQLTPPDSVNVQAQKIDDAWRKYLPQVIMSKNDGEFEAAWQQMLTTIEKNGLADMNAAYTKLWADFLANYKEALGN